FRDGVEDPEALARLHIETAHVALDVGLALRLTAREMGRTHDHRVPRDERRGVQTHLARDEVNPLVVIQLKVDRAILTEGGDWHAGLCIQRDQAIAGRYVKYPFIAPVLPPGDATAR